MDEVVISGEVICTVVCFEAGKQIKLLGQRFLLCWYLLWSSALLDGLNN